MTRTSGEPTMICAAVRMSDMIKQIPTRARSTVATRLNAFILFLYRICKVVSAVVQFRADNQRVPCSDESQQTDDDDARAAKDVNGEEGASK